VPIRPAVSALLAHVVPSQQPASGSAAATAIPALTAEERARALDVLSSDPMAVRLLGERRYTVARMGPWHTARTKDKLGAALLVVLAQPARVAGAWPEARYDRLERTSRPYTVAVTRYVAENVRGLMILVDLARGKVVSILPEVDARIVPPRGFEPTPPAHVD
jgi:hypothetical protein